MTQQPSGPKAPDRYEELEKRIEELEDQKGSILPDLGKEPVAVTQVIAKALDAILLYFGLALGTIDPTLAFVIIGVIEAAALAISRQKVTPTSKL